MQRRTLRPAGRDWSRCCRRTTRRPTCLPRWSRCAARARRPDRGGRGRGQLHRRHRARSPAGTAPRSSHRRQHRTRRQARSTRCSARLCRPCSHDDLVLVMDADSLLDPTFLADARPRAHLGSGTRRLGGVGGTFTGRPRRRLLGMFQRNEYARYARDVRRLKGKALVLTGTASVFPVRRPARRAQARRAGAAARTVPAGAGLRHPRAHRGQRAVARRCMHLGYRILAPRGCTLDTEVMTDLARPRAAAAALEARRAGEPQRLRPHPRHRAVLGPAGAGALGVLATVLYLGSLLWGLMVGHHTAALLAGGVAGLRRRAGRHRPHPRLAADAAGRAAGHRDGLRRVSSVRPGLGLPSGGPA